MTTPIQHLTGLTRELQKPLSLEEMLQIIVDCTAVILDTPRASIRLLDPGGTRLLAVCRAGSPLHINPSEEFKTGEGLIGWIVEHSTPVRTGDADSDPRFVQRAGLKGRMGSFLGVPVISGNASLGVISATNSQPDYFTRDNEEHLGLLAGICAPHVEIARLKRLATVDPLTGALNRRGFDEQFPEVAARESDLIEPLSVVMADIDHFKKINDRYGHAMGDQVLKMIAEIFSGALRKGDAVVRVGGEEFLLVLPQVSLATAAKIAERARRAVESAGFSLGETRLRSTVSFGAAERRSGEDRADLIRRADEALYQAKNGGRNRVEMAS